MAKLQPSASSALDSLDAIAQRYTAGPATGHDEVTVPLLCKRWGKRRESVRNIVVRMEADGVLMYVRSHGALKIYKVVNAEQHEHNGKRGSIGVV